MFRTPAVARSLLHNSSRRIAAAPRVEASQIRQAHAISNPTLAGIEKRWEVMPPQEQAELWMALRDRMKVDWKEMTIQEKKAAYWIAFGPHGPRAEAPPGQTRKVIIGIIGIMVGSGVLFGLIRLFARPPPSTLNKEWQEATEAYLKDMNVEPITGISNPNWKGNFAVQSPPKEKK